MLILASNSPRRKEILKKAGFKFKTVSPKFDESAIKEQDPYRLTELLAYNKAKSISNDYINDIVVGSDTIVHLDGELLGKPKDTEDAFNMLKKMSGTIHEVVTGVAVITPDKTIVFHEVSKVQFKDLSDKEIKDYIKTGESMDKAGSYAIQEGANGFVIDYTNEIENIVGFPIESFKKHIKENKIKIYN